MRMAVKIGSALISLFTHAQVMASEFVRPWMDTSTVLILDPFAGNSINFDQLAQDKRVVGIIHQASRGLDNVDGKYSWRRTEAKGRGYVWGSYHLLTTADTRAQIDRYLQTVGSQADEAYAIDVECLASDMDCKKANYKVSPNQVLAALRYFRQKTGRLPLLYVNHHVKSELAPKIAADADLKSTRLWYARFKSDISSFFPDDNWKSYTIWQFSSEINCFAPPGTCPYRVPGTRPDMDVNVYFGSEQKLRQAWPLN